jgi:hypothetical protein
VLAVHCSSRMGAEVDGWSLRLPMRVTVAEDSVRVDLGRVLGLLMGRASAVTVSHGSAEVSTSRILRTNVVTFTRADMRLRLFPSSPVLRRMLAALEIAGFTVTDEIQRA